MYTLLLEAAKLGTPGPVAIDNFVFRLHYGFTCILLVAATLLLGAKQYYGEPIHCLVDNLPDALVNAYCWTHGTWTTPALATDALQNNVAFPGVGLKANTHRVLQHTYYQWVPLMLALSALCFYAPRAVWGALEGGKLAAVCADMRGPCLGTDCVSKVAERTGTLKRYFSLESQWSSAVYACEFVVCEALNLVNVVVQWLVTDMFLNGAFSAYGHRLMRYASAAEDDDEAADPAEVYFPKMAHCSIRKHGPSGDVQRMEGFCALPLNVLNEKIYAALWAWFVVLTAATAANTAYRIALICSTTLRTLSLRLRLWSVSAENVSMVCSNTTFSRWFALSQMAKNVDCRTMEKLINTMAYDIRYNCDKENKDTAKKGNHIA